MKAAFYTGASGLIAYQKYMDVIGNNLTNVLTPGYKPNEVSFQNLLSTEMYVNTDTNPLSGSGVKTVNTGINANQSSLQPSSYDLDFAIMGDGFFATQLNGTTAYTRDGSFTISLENGTPYLVTQEGRYVLDAQGQKITIPSATGDDAKNGVQYDYEAVRQKLGIYHFNHPGALQPISGNNYGETELSGKATVSANETSSVVRMALENSGANMMDEMVDMISAQRAYQISARVLQTADENEQTINNLRK